MKHNKKMFFITFLIGLVFLLGGCDNSSINNNTPKTTPTETPTGTPSNQGTSNDPVPRTHITDYKSLTAYKDFNDIYSDEVSEEEWNNAFSLENTKNLNYTRKINMTTKASQYGTVVTSKTEIVTYLDNNIAYQETNIRMSSSYYDQSTSQVLYAFRNGDKIKSIYKYDGSTKWTYQESDISSSEDYDFANDYSKFKYVNGTYIDSNTPIYVTTNGINVTYKNIKVKITDGVIAYISMDLQSTQSGVTQTGEVTVKSYNFTSTNVIVPSDVQNLYDLNNPKTYEIESVEDLVNIKNDLNAIYEIKNDIDMTGVEWLPVGSSEKPFTGKIHGNGFKISNLNINSNSTDIGFIGVNDGEISNLNLECTVNASGLSKESRVGGLVGTNNKNGIIIKVSVDGTITTANHSSEFVSYTGGLSGYDNGSITYCINKADVTGIAYAGGISGYSNDATLIYLSNEGTVTSLNYAGGITAYQNAKIATIKNMNNIGDITGSYYAGGLLGYYGKSDSTITMCGNAGTISANAFGQSNAIAGGLIAKSDSTTTFSDCYNKGNVTSTGYYAGGIVGSGVTKVIRCFNSGSVRGSLYGGGLFGKGAKTISDSVNFGTTRDSFGSTGGTITNCYASKTSNSFQGTEQEPTFDKDFYLNSVFFSDDVWEFSENAYPNLKWEKEDILATSE